MAAVTSPREKRIVGTSLKMYFDLHTTTNYIEAIAKLSKAADNANVDLFVIPDFVSLVSAQQKLANTNVLLGAQDCFSETTGAYTGEVSARTLRQAGVKIVEIGHAERRRLFGETNQAVAAKARAIVNEGMIPLICVGETTRSNIASQAVGFAVSECKIQLDAALSSLSDAADLVIAYEPVWAIGAGEPAGADHVVAVVQNLRALVAGRGGRTRIIYGGSAGPGTFKKLDSSVDGLFLGRFAHDVDNVKQIIAEMS